MLLHKQVAIVTGSTSGIGLGIARALSEQGATVVLNGFADRAEVERIQQELSGRGGEIDYSPADLSRPDEIDAMMRTVLERHGRVDILVNNAGIQHTARNEAFPPERWDQI